MFSAARIRDDFSAAASVYDAHAGLQQRLLRHLLAKARPFITPGMRILDAGCGTGQLARELTGHNILQIDNALAMCREALPHAPAALATVKALPFADHAFDMVFSSLVLQWVEDWPGAIAEMKRIVKPGGVLALSLFGDGSLAELKESFGAADAFPHVSPFPALEHVRTCFAAMESLAICEYAPDVASLMRQIKSIGASNKLATRRKALMTPRQMERAQSFYRANFADARGLRVSWNLLCGVMRL